MNRLAFICINGINTLPGDAEGWTDRAVTWLNLHVTAEACGAEGKAEKFEYATGALTRRLRQQWRAQAIARMANFYAARGYELVFIGHSNGCDLIERVLALRPWDHVRSVHLFAPACDGDMLLAHINRGYLDHAHLYGSANDRALQIAALSRRFLGWAGLGYGDLGRRVDAFADYHNGNATMPPQIHAHRDDAQTHSSWFARGDAFERTMRMLLRHEFPATP